MNIQKRNRLIAAGTVTIVLLLVVLVAIMIYLLVVIVDLNKRKNELKEQIAEYYDSINAPGGLKDQLEYYEDYDALFQLAVEYEIIGKK